MKRVVVAASVLLLLVAGVGACLGTESGNPSSRGGSGAGSMLPHGGSDSFGNAGSAAGGLGVPTAGTTGGVGAATGGTGAGSGGAGVTDAGVDAGADAAPDNDAGG